MKIKINFQKEELGPYTEERINEVWNNPPSITTYAKPTIVKDGNKKVLQLSFPKGTFGQDHKVNWHLKLKKSYEVLYCQYKVKFDKDFDFKRGGKLPGFAGGDKPAGGRHSMDGFSARIMWREKGLMHQYVYYPHPDHGDFGSCFFWHDLCSKKMEPLKFEPGKWHTIKTRIQMNEFKWRGNGYITSWLDGKLALHQDVKLRAKDKKYGIDWFVFTVFFGGGDKTWAPRRDCKVYFDDFIISDKEIGNA